MAAAMAAAAAASQGVVPGSGQGGAFNFPLNFSNAIGSPGFGCSSPIDAQNLMATMASFAAAQSAGINLNNADLPGLGGGPVMPQFLAQQANLLGAMNSSFGSLSFTTSSNVCGGPLSLTTSSGSFSYSGFGTSGQVIPPSKSSTPVSSRQRTSSRSPASLDILGPNQPDEKRRRTDRVCLTHSKLM